MNRFLPNRRRIEAAVCRFARLSEGVKNTKTAEKLRFVILNAVKDLVVESAI